MAFLVEEVAIAAEGSVDPYVRTLGSAVPCAPRVTRGRTDADRRVSRLEGSKQVESSRGVPAHGPQHMTEGKATEMKNLALNTIVKLQDRKMQLDIQRDEEGLTMLAYALGAAAITADPRMSMKVLRFANSAALAQRNPAKTVREAVMAIGFDETRRLAMGVAMLSMVRTLPRYLDLDDVRYHGLAVAKRWREHDEDGALAGVLQNAGVLAMTADADLFDRYSNRVGETTDYEDLHNLERELYGVARCDLARMTLSLWKMPESVSALATTWHLCENVDTRFYLDVADCGLQSPSSLMRWLAVR